MNDHTVHIHVPRPLPEGALTLQEIIPPLLATGYDYPEIHSTARAWTAHTGLDVLMNPRRVQVATRGQRIPTESWALFAGYLVSGGYQPPEPNPYPTVIPVTERDVAAQDYLKRHPHLREDLLQMPVAREVFEGPSERERQRQEYVDATLRNAVQERRLRKGACPCPKCAGQWDTGTRRKGTRNRSGRKKGPKKVRRRRP